METIVTIWDMITKCWSEQRETRWDIRTVVHQLSLSSIQEVAEAQKDVLGAVPESAPERQIAHPHVEPQLGRLGVMGQRSQGPPSDFRELQRVAQNFQPPPSKRNPFQRFRPSELFGRPHQKKLGTPTGIASQANEPGQLPAMIDGAPENLSGLKPSMYNLGYSPSLSVQRFGGSMEISAVLTSSSGIESDGSEPSSDPPPLNLAEINATCKDRVSQDYIDWLDVVCYLEIAFHTQANVSLRRWTMQHAIKNDINCSITCARSAVVSGCYPTRCTWGEAWLGS
ncbi:hypothetical protein BJ322DRAFT_531888 [Thelephora terrestris]|uniref:Uncharacterized protein n=1 Tax=Thelephora terrestris TaxID=56493 RepID=A0A9P6HKV5_9AGAM|nr:hypothetical protein BJ322DRAFT_531888 [Thelephora terrestris]